MTDSLSPRALIVDDNWFNRDLSILALKHVGFEVTEAQNGKEALGLLGQQEFDLMILDLAMPEMDGTSLIRRIRHDGIAANMPIVVMTANPHMATDELADQVDFVMYKPINVTEFAQLVRRLRKHPGRPA